ncbi:Glycyl-tRNA synthetase beta chain [hydrothermal vent metagenome]|uniref:glycine--tRNA ligase n=1 Tax=hydrothermal vent metagenome TaxID=652676 RepID=A0A3B1BN38_9ZZZZ
MSLRDLLIEIGTEELPPKALNSLSTAFLAGVRAGLQKAGLSFSGIDKFASPRRLALRVCNLAESQPDKNIERKGPALRAAYGEDGCPTKAAQGFARSCGVEVEDLQKQETDKGSWLVFRSEQKGRPSASLVPAIINEALDKLPIPRRMRWGRLETQFVRPVHWVVLLFGDTIIEAEILGIQAGRETLGHRFHHPQAISIPAPADYEVLLESSGKVIADFDRRRQTVRAQIEKEALRLNGQAVINDDLLDEVTAMVEWPVAVAGNFEARFLDVPPEALISTMAANQKYFHLLDADGKLLPHFITISNIESRDPDKIREGNERVIRPRFADAEFFWNQDRKQRLDARLESLKSVVFQKQLGSLFDKTWRVIPLSAWIAEAIGADKVAAMRAAELCKCDLMTEMVGEFPGLQGIMGRYYAQHDQEPEDVATALDDYYRPRFAGDTLPSSAIAQALAIADRIDTLLGIFATGQIPTGDRDPYALRRAALGVLRILIEKNLDLDLRSLLETAAKHFGAEINAGAAIEQVLSFILDRLQAYYQDKDIKADVLEAVISTQPTCPLDIDQRIQAVSHFRELPEAKSLAAANKRIGNILKKVTGNLPQTINASALLEAEEKTLYQILTGLSSEVQTQLEKNQYEQALTQLAQLRDPIDRFFDKVMVMTEDEKLRDNRIALLNQLHTLFMRVADISRLQN